MSDDVFPLDIPGNYLDRRFPEWDVTNKLALSGKRSGSTWALEPTVGYGIKAAFLRSVTQNEYQELLSFLGSHFGPLDSFLFTDPEDNAASDPTVQGGGHCFGVGDGTTRAFQLQRRVNAQRRDRNSGTKWRSSSGPRTNLLLSSLAFSSSFWTYSTGVTFAINASLAPDNTPANVFAYDGTGSAGGVRFSTNPVVPSSPYCGSIWLRADTPTTVRIGTASAAILVCNLTTSWQRFAFLATSSADFGVWSPAGVNTAFRIYAWGAQSELDVASTGVPTRLIPTTTTALTQNPQLWPAYADSFLPVYEPNGPLSIFRQDWQGVVQLFPWPRTNLVLQSAALDNATWQKVSSTITPNSTAAPDGTTTADTFNEGTGAATAHFVDQLLTSPSGETRCYSVFVKAGTLPNIIFGRDLGTSIKFNLGTGAIDGVNSGTVLASGVITLANGWFRIWFITTESGANPNGNAYVFGAQNSAYTESYTGTSRTFFLWGFQAEQTGNLNGPGVYIPTTTVAVSVTDYVLALGLVTLATAPLAAAVLSWLGSYYIRVRLDDSAQKGVELQRIVQAMWSTGLQLVSVIP